MTKEEARAAVSIVAAVAEAIRELKEVPSGHLYASLMGRMSLAEFEGVIALLKRTELVKENCHLLSWAGPTF